MVGSIMIMMVHSEIGDNLEKSVWLFGNNIFFFFSYRSSYWLAGLRVHLKVHTLASFACSFLSLLLPLRHLTLCFSLHSRSPLSSYTCYPRNPLHPLSLSLFHTRSLVPMPMALLCPALLLSPSPLPPMLSFYCSLPLH